MDSVFPITVDLKDGKKKFGKGESVEKFLQEITAEYEWLPGGLDMADAIRNQLAKQVNAARTHLATVMNPDSAAQNLVGHADEVKVHITNIIDGPAKVYQKGSARLEYCKRLGETDPMLGAATLWAMLRPGQPSNNPPQFTRGVVTATLYDLGLTDHREDFPPASDHLLENAQTTLDNINNSLVDADARIESFRTRSTKRRVNQRKEYSELLDHTRNRWKDLERTYEEKLALKYSVSYWSEKAREYGKNSWLFAAGAGIAAGGFAYTIGWWAVQLFETIGESHVTRWYQVSIVAVYATIGIWILRLLTKSLMANMHLKVDAEHRVTMITTYLALLKEGRALENDDRRLIIEALFRPAHSGLVSAESQGQSMIEQIAALLTRRGSN